MTYNHAVVMHLHTTRALSRTSVIATKVDRNILADDGAETAHARTVWIGGCPGHNRLIFTVVERVVIVIRLVLDR